VKKTPVAKPSGRRSLTGGAAIAAALPLAIATIIPAALNASKGGGDTAKKSTSKTAVAFQPDCKLPFDSIKTLDLEVDTTCTLDGNAGTDTAKRLENNAKNNFCVKGDPTPITYDDFKGLQQTADGSDDLRTSLKTSRARLIDLFAPAGRPKLGEGTLVQFVSFVLDAHPSNVGQGKGENVNCKLPTKDDNDIHIELTMDLADDDPCNGVTAEMSPHFRPEAWSELVDLKKFARPVRITGPLFFDDSHQPCHDGVRPNPKRTSVWEIHPVYQLEVCKAKEKTLAVCSVGNNSVWVPFDQFRSTNADEK
jgi:hypothetical protein